MNAVDPLQALLTRMTATPSLDKLHAWASNVKLDDEFVEDERRFEAKQDAYWAARAEDEGDGEEEVAA